MTDDAGIDRDAVLEAVATARDFGAALQGMEGADILATAKAWEVRHDPSAFHSIGYMDDEDLAKAVVEDLLSVFYWKRKGKDVVLTRGTIVRHVPVEMRERVWAALDDPFVRSLLVEGDDGELGIHPHHLQDAMDYSGVVHEGFADLMPGATIRLAR